MWSAGNSSRRSEGSYTPERDRQRSEQSPPLSRCSNASSQGVLSRKGSMDVTQSLSNTARSNRSLQCDEGSVQEDVSLAPQASFFKNKSSTPGSRSSARSERDAGINLQESHNTTSSGDTKGISSSMSNEKLEAACSKYGLTTESIEEILSGRMQSRELVSERSDTSSDCFREEMLIYLLKQQVKLKNQLKQQKKNMGAVTQSEYRKASYDRTRDKQHTRTKRCKDLRELTKDELESFEEMMEDNSPMSDTDATISENVHGPSRTHKKIILSDIDEYAMDTDLYSSQEASPAVGDTRLSRQTNVPRNHRMTDCRLKKQSSADTVISQEADSLHNEIDQLIYNLENNDIRGQPRDVNPEPVQYGVPPIPNTFVYPPNFYDFQANMEPEEVVLPIKVPIKPPTPEVCDAEVMTNETARVREVNEYDMFERDIEDYEEELKRSHQTDYTRVGKDGISWEITESYLKEEERRMLQERKRAELLKQLNDPIGAKGPSLKDHYNKWVSQRDAKTSNVKKHNCLGVEKQATMNEENVGPIHIPNIFRRRREYSRERETPQSEMPRQKTDPRHDARNKDPMNDETRFKDVYIRGTWDPKTGAIKISNALDSNQFTDKNRTLDEYINFLKQNPGNWSQEVMDTGIKPKPSEEDVDASSGEESPEVEVSPEETARTDTTDSTYDRDEFHVAPGPIPSDAEPDYSPGMRRKYAMGFSDYYVPPMRNHPDMYNPGMCMMPRGHFNMPEEPKHHHYHYYSDHRHKRCHHKRKHKHCCSRKRRDRVQCKCSHEDVPKDVEPPASDTQDATSTTPGSDSLMSTVTSTRDIVTPLSVKDIVNNVLHAKSTDFVKVTTYHDAPRSPKSAGDNASCMLNAMSCCTDVAVDKDDASPKSPKMVISKYPKVFQVRGNTRATATRSVSPLRKLEGCFKEAKAVPETTKVEYDTDAEFGEQFTFREGNKETQQKDASPMFKTKAIYVGENAT
ncbi:hypothetical protein BBOV_III011190 [Babesia bovis T2Bo]|uniref:hypothetical protein n=1 Tax=Babesia bovis T2Bo TaxID=484906 RepID=UPI001C34ACA8|nr:hypothetical protein BBOV_III011190 [Babesia bovis T2Bo]EDO08671.2 hypothetical protein BBOV_III011190 [Babesia bovis T2Bo]